LKIFAGSDATERFSMQQLARNQADNIGLNWSCHFPSCCWSCFEGNHLKAIFDFDGVKARMWKPSSPFISGQEKGFLRGLDPEANLDDGGGESESKKSHH